MHTSGTYLFTSESVAKGHPDKLADQISDFVLDQYLAQDPDAHAGVETLVTTNRVILAGEVRGPESVRANLEEGIRHLVRDIGYNQEGFHWERLTFHNYLHEQSPDIAMGVDRADQAEMGAGDQGIMFGYACTDTDTFMPAPHYWSNQILLALDRLRREHNAHAKETHAKETHAKETHGKETHGKGMHSQETHILGPDAKTQITFEFKNNVPVSVKTIVLSTQHRVDVTQDQVKDMVIPLIHNVIPSKFMSADTQIFINPTGRFVIGGPDSDCGLTGRKIIVDTYGGSAPHGGGAFSGKDPTKVDRSAAYMARYLAKNIVAAGVASRCLIQLSYGIGIAKPLSLYVNFMGTGRVPEVVIEKIIQDNFPLTPYSIISHLALKNPIYKSTACYGHFGRTPTDDGHFTWEKLDCVGLFKY